MKLKRIMALVICFTMVLSTMSFSVFAEDDTSYVAQIGDEKFETVLAALTAAKESTTATEVKLLQDSTELLATDFEFIVKSDVVITSETPVTVAFYNEGTTYDLIFGSENNNTIIIDSNVTLKVNDRNIWLGYYGDKNVTVKVYGTLSAGYQLWSGSDVEVYGTLESLGEALVLRRGKNLTVDGGKVDASYFSILAGNIDAKNDAVIECGPVWISNTGNYANEGNVEIALDNATLISSSNLKSTTTHEDGVSITIMNGSTASFLGNEHGESQLDENTNLVVSGNSTQLNIVSLTNNGTIEVTEGGKVSATGTVNNNGTIEVENEDDFEGAVSGNKPEIPAVIVANIDGTDYETLADALEATKEMSGDVVIDLLADAELSYGAREAYGKDDTTSITINGNNNTLTLNQTDSDWSSIGMKNANGIFKMNDVNVVKTGYGVPGGAWNTHAINFNVNTELTNVDFDNSIKVSGTSVLTDVNIVEDKEYYGIWIPADAESVTINGGSITATNGGRGIKIADQYVDAPAKVQLTVDGMSFETAKKAAVLVSSIGGADITATNYDISKVAADSQNFAWIDDGKNENNEKYTDYADQVKVNDEAAFVEGTVATINGVGYTNVATAFAQAVADDEVVIHAAGTYAVPTGKNIIITGAVDGVVFDNIGACGLYADVTFNNVTFDYYPNVDYTGLQHSGNLVYNDCTFNGQVFLYGTSETFNKCTFNQESSGAYNVWTYSAKKVTFNECTFNSAGKSVLIYHEGSSTFNDVSVTDCDFIASAPVDGKAAIEMDSSLTVGINLVIDSETTATGFDKGSVSGNSLWNNKKGSKGANNDIVVTVDGETVLKPKFEVSTKAELDAAISNAADGDTICLTADIDYGSDQLKIEKPITLDLGGFTLTTANNWGGMSLKNNPTIKNGNIKHNGNTAAIKAWNVAAFEDLTIEVVYTEGKTKGGIVIQSGTSVCVDSIKNVTIKGDGLTNGIETYNCGDATNDVIGSMENVTIDAVGTAMNISAPVGTATGCTFDGDVNGIEIWIKGNYSAKLDLVDCDVKGGVYAHDEFSSNPNIQNNGTLSLTTDADTTGASEDDITLIIARAEEVEGILEAVMNNAKAKVGDTYYATLETAIVAAQPNSTIILLADVNENVTINKSITLDGADKNYTGKMTISKSINLTIDNVNFIGGNIVKGKNTGVQGTYTITNCSFDSDSNSVYAIEIRGSNSIIIENCTSEGYYGFLQVPSTNDNVSIKDVTIEDTGYAIKVDYSNGVSLDNVTITNSTYGFVNSNWGTKTITVKNCTIKADYPLVIWDRNTKAVNTFKFEGNNDFGTNAFYYQTVTEEEKAYTKYVLGENATLTAVADLGVTSDNDAYFVKYVDNTYKSVKAIAQIGDVKYETIQDAVNAATDDSTITVLSDVTNSDPVVINKSVTIDGNGHTLTYTGTDRAIDVPSSANGANVTVKGLTILAESANRGINYNTNGALKVENVTVNVDGYAINFPSSSDNATVEIKDSKLTSCIPVNVWGSDMNISMVDTDITSVDNSTQFSYSGIQLNHDAYGNVADGTKVTVTGGSITATDEAGNPSIAVSIWSSTGKVEISDTTVVTGEVKTAVAMCAGAGFYTLQDAIDEVVKYNYNAPIVIIRDIELTESVSVPNGANITLDLNGKTITGTDTTEKNFGLIDNRGNLTITGNGTMTLTATVDSGWNRYSAVIANNPGGKLTIENGTIEHLGGTAMAYGIDNLTNGKGTYAETIINDGTIKSTYRGIRQFLNGVEAQNILTVNGGTVEGGNKGIWVQDPSAKANIGTITIEENASVIGGVYLSVTEGSTEWPVTVKIAKKAIDKLDTSNIPEAYTISLANGYYGVSAARSLNIASEKSELYAGDTVRIDVNIGGVNMTGATWTLNWNPDYFKPVDAEHLDNTGSVTDSAYNEDENNSVWTDGQVIKTYTFEAIAQDGVEVEGLFWITEPNATAHDEAFDGADIETTTNDPAKVKILLNDYSFVTKINGDEITETSKEVSFDGNEYKFVVEPVGLDSTVNYTITYKVNGEDKTEVSLKDEDTYVIEYKIDAQDGYADKTGTFTLTIKEADYKLEVTQYTDESDLVLIYTNTENLRFKYNGNLMIKVSDKRLDDAKYKLNGTDEYDYVYGYVAHTTVQGYDHSQHITYTGNREEVFAIDNVYLADINFTNSLNIQDIVTVFGVANDHPTLHANVRYQKQLLKADVNCSKNINGDDTGYVVTEVRSALNLR